MTTYLTTYLIFHSAMMKPTKRILVNCNMKGEYMKALIISGSSAAGKTTVTSLICEKQGMVKIPSYTTRKKRSEEDCNSGYIFVTDRDEFFKLYVEGNLIEYEEYEGSGALYGTDAVTASKMAKEKKDIVFVTTANAHEAISKFCHAQGYDVFSVYLYAHPAIELMRIKGRGTADESQVMKRMEANLKDMKEYSSRYDVLLDTSGIEPEDVAEIIIDTMESGHKGMSDSDKQLYMMEYTYNHLMLASE